MAIERELKLGLPDDATYRRVAEALGGRPSDTKEQTNLFFDAPDRRLIRAGWVWRLRWAKGRLIVTAKASGSRRDDVAERLEFERRLDPEAARVFSPDDFAPGALLDLDRLEAFDPGGSPDESPFALRRRFDLPPTLECLGGFRNLRLVFPFESPAGGAWVELDRTTFGPGDEEFEIELEASGPSAEVMFEALRAFLADLRVSTEPRSSKFHRFAQRAGLIPR